ncbi:MAG: ArnT family glycosyltransferase [Anaerolineae bacterium]
MSTRGSDDSAQVLTNEAGAIITRSDLTEQSSPGLTWATWRATVIFTLALLASRVIYLIWLWPHELFGDEAQYWDWSRRLDLSYYSKGPGVAWVIAASTSLFGDREWAIRLPAVVASAVGALALARLANECSKGDQRVGFFTAVTFCLAPGYQGSSIFMTTDSPSIALWIIAAWAAWHVFNQPQNEQPPLFPWIVLALALATGFLFRYTNVLLVPGLIIYAILHRHQIKWGLTAAIRALGAAIVFLVVISPVFVWNHRRGWPAVAHLLGHLGAPGGDWPHRGPWSYDPLWTLEFLGSQVAIIGPAAVLIALATRAAIRTRKEQPRQWFGHALMIWCAAPILILHLFLSFVTDVEANWPLPGYATLFVLVGQLVVVKLLHYRRVVGQRRRDPTMPGPLGRRDTLFQVAWRGSIGLGVATMFFFLFLNVVAQVPVIGTLVPLHRVTGHRELAARIQTLVRQSREQTSREPFVVARGYMTTALLAFYLPGHPAIYSAQNQLGSRKSSYDFFDDTDLTDPKLLGRPAVLIGDSPEKWKRAFKFDRLEQAGRDVHAYIGFGYWGPNNETHTKP